MSKLLILFLLFLAISKMSLAQLNKRDTINFFIDNKIPTNDRMIEISQSDNFTQYEINCPCLLSNSSPVFIYMNKSYESTLSVNEFKKVSYTPLPVLLKLIKLNYLIRDINEKYVFFFYEKDNKKYSKKKVIFNQPRESNSNNSGMQ